MIGFDPIYWLFALPGLLLGLWAQFKLHSAYGKYSQVPTQSGLTGAEAARRILDRAGLRNVPVEMVAGRLSDHYDPTKRALFLSVDNFQGRSIAAVGVAAHEAGHALQHQAAYGLFKLRMALVPATQFASYAWGGILLLGWILGRAMFAKFIFLAVGLFGVLTLFQLITLPVEYDASRRAKQQLAQLGLIHPGESEGVEKVLGAAALTYVAALVSSVLELLYLLSMARDNRR
jgi:Zn-dependent membrane protease YugP